MKEGTPSIYPPGETPWEKVNKEARESGHPYEESGPDIWHGLPLGQKDKIGDLAPFEVQMVEEGDFSPLIKRLETLPDGSERDKLVIQLDADLSLAERLVDSAMDLLEAREGTTPANDEIASFVTKSRILRSAIEKVRSYCSGEMPETT